MGGNAVPPAVGGGFVSVMIEMIVAAARKILRPSRPNAREWDRNRRHASRRGEGGWGGRRGGPTPGIYGCKNPNLIDLDHSRLASDRELPYRLTCFVARHGSGGR